MHFGRILLATASLLAGWALAANSPGCGKAPTLRDGTYTAQVNNRARQYILRLPRNYNQNTPYKLIFTFHALGGNAQQIATGTGAYYGIPPLANETAIFVSPNGRNAGWANVGGEDILFVDAMIEAIESQLCVNQNLRFSTGFSYGAAMSYAIACARATKFRAIGMLSGGAMSGCQGGAPSTPIAFYQQHGTYDQVLPVSGARNLRNALLRVNGCTPVTPEPAPNGAMATKVEYKGCKAGYPSTWVIFTGDHTPAYRDAGGSGPMAGPNVWKFFSQFE